MYHWLSEPARIWLRRPLAAVWSPRCRRPPCDAGWPLTRSSRGSIDPGSFRDPDFAIKATRVLDLYARTFDNEPLGDDDYVLSADEKPGVQARSRVHPSRPPRPQRRPMRVESEYRRHGTLAYLAAYDVHRAQVIGHCAPSTGIEPFSALVDKIMTREPYTSARRVFWVVDNGASHRGWTSAKRLSDAYPNTKMIHLPVHASWLNQIEIYFSVVQRK
jgi:DDE superfamily endonuclease